MKTIAVVGMSPKPERPSHYVSVYMSQNGYNIIPVNPGHNSIMGKTSYSSLLDIKENVDIVNVFRRSEYVLPIINDAVSIKAKAVWLQDGIISEEGEKIAKENEILFIMNDCLLRRHKQYNG
jgi:hypothetical protein|tara:strand:- start:510 stop:875 length:366 start_codon:yes stop_codon:yes gene_type:complete